MVPTYLHSKGIPCVVCGEDAARHYGALTAISTLAVLVNDVEEAERCLSDSGLKRIQIKTEDHLEPYTD